MIDPYDPEGNAGMDGVQEQFRGSSKGPASMREGEHSVYVAIPTTWEPDRFFAAINRVVWCEVGDAVFYATPDEADQANRNAGADPDKFRIVRVTMDAAILSATKE